MRQHIGVCFTGPNREQKARDFYRTVATQIKDHGLYHGVQIVRSLIEYDIDLKVVTTLDEHQLETRVAAFAALLTDIDGWTIVGPACNICGSHALSAKDPEWVYSHRQRIWRCNNNGCDWQIPVRDSSWLSFIDLKELAMSQVRPQPFLRKDPPRQGTITGRFSVQEPPVQPRTEGKEEKGEPILMGVDYASLEESVLKAMIESDPEIKRIGGVENRELTVVPFTAPMPHVLPYSMMAMANALKNREIQVGHITWGGQIPREAPVMRIEVGETAQKELIKAQMLGQIPKGTTVMDIAAAQAKQVEQVTETYREAVQDLRQKVKSANFFGMAYGMGPQRLAAIMNKEVEAELKEVEAELKEAKQKIAQLEDDLRREKAANTRAIGDELWRSLDMLRVLTNQLSQDPPASVKVDLFHNISEAIFNALNMVKGGSE